MIGGVLLALDMGPTATGMAVGDLSQKLPIAKFWDMPELGGSGAIYCDFVDKLSDAIELYKPDRLALERPLSVQGMLGKCQTEYIHRILKQLGDVIEFGCRYSIPVVSFGVNTIRSDILGRCRWPGGRDEAKKVVMAHVRGLGLRTTSFDAADAAMVWFYYQRLVRKNPSSSGATAFRDAAD